MIQALAAAILVPLALISGVLGVQSVRDHLAFRDLDQAIAQTPENPNSQHATNPADVKQPDFFPAPSAAGAPTTSVVGSNQAVSNNASPDYSLPPPTGAVLGETDTQPVVERVIETVRTVIEGGLTAADVDARMLALRQSLEAQINTVAAKTDTKSETIYQTLGMVARIENLHDVNLTDITVDGVAGLTDADIPDAITASNYLPLTGGSISGDLTLSGTLTAGSLSVAALSSGGAIEGPYVNATSTTATSTFSGGITGPGSFTVQSSSGNVGIGTTSPLVSLDVRKDQNAATYSRVRNFDTGGSASAQFAADTDGGILWLAQNSATGGAAAVLGTTGLGDFNFLKFNSGGDFVFKTTTSNTERLRVASGGNVGIGQTSPTYKLDVTGLGRFTGLVDASHFVATSTTASSFAGGLTAYASSTIGNGTQAGGLTISGGATTTGNAYIAGNLGINTNAPTALLDVRSSGSVGLKFSAAVGLQAWTTGVSAYTNLGTQSSSDIVDFYNSSNAMVARLRSTGALSLGNTNANYQLDVTGDGRFTGLVDAANFVATSSSATSTFAGGITGPGSFTVQSSSGRVGVGTSNPRSKLDVTAGDVTLDDGYAVLLNAASQTASIFHSTANGGRTTIDAPSGENIYLRTGATARLVVDGTGNVGIGTTSPYAKLSVTNTGTGPSFVVEDSTSPDTTPFIIDASGNVGIGTTSPQTALHADGSGKVVRVGNSADGRYAELYGGTAGGTGPAVTLNGTGDWGVSAQIKFDRAGTTYWSTGLFGSVSIGNDFYIGNSANDTSSAEFLIQRTTGNVGIGTTSPWRTLSVTGTVGFDGLTGSTGAGSLCLDSNKQVVYNSGSDSCLSSTRATKHDITPLALDDLATVDALLPVSFVYNGSEQVRYGFIAEDTANVDAHLATYEASGAVSGIDDRSILAIVIGAIKQIASITGAFRDALIAWLGDATNGLTRVHTRELCIDDICVTRDQFAEVFGSSQNAAAAGTQGDAASTGVPGGSSTSGPPDTDTATTTTVVESTEAAGTPEVSGTGAPAVDAAAAGEAADEASPTTPLDNEPQTPAEAANDNEAADLPAPGTN